MTASTLHPCTKYKIFLHISDFFVSLHAEYVQQGSTRNKREKYMAQEEVIKLFDAKEEMKR